MDRENGWTLAEHAGTVSSDEMHRLLRTAGWDVDGVRDDRAVAHQTRHRSPATIGTYVRVHAAWNDNAATQLGL